MARSQSELFMQQLLGSCSDRSLSLSLSQVHASGSPSDNCLARSAQYTRLQSPNWPILDAAIGACSPAPSKTTGIGDFPASQLSGLERSKAAGTGVKTVRL